MKYEWKICFLSTAYIPIYVTATPMYLYALKDVMEMAMPSPFCTRLAGEKSFDGEN